jgi:hypothetical protein
VNREDVWDIETSRDLLLLMCSLITMLEREDCDSRAYGPETDRRGVCDSRAYGPETDRRGVCGSLL